MSKLAICATHLYLPMKKYLLAVVLINLLTVTSFAQEETVVPLTQEEYVRMLYQAEQTPGKVEELVTMVRARGIAFELSRGLRSLTRSKTQSDAELIRTLEEANRRRENPRASARPPSRIALQLIEKTRANTIAAVDEMPDFVVKQRIRRSVAYAGTNNFQGLDRLIVAVSYRADGREEYRLLSQNGVVKSESRNRSDYSEVGGTSSTGEFVTVLSTVFRPESETRFEFLDTDLLRGRRALVYDFSITRDRARQQITSYGYIADSTTSGMSGRIWIDRELGRVLRLDSRATEIPPDFPVTAARRVIDYEWVTIGDDDFLLPSSSDVRLTFRERAKSYESKNFIEFKDYQKYGTEVQILDDDTEFVEDPTPSLDNGGPPPLKKPVDP